MIEFRKVTVTYAEASAPVLESVDLVVPEGELCLVVGETGSGKSTLLRCVNGLVPHFTGGTLSGSVVVDGRSTRDHHPRDLADVVGFVGQDPLAGFVTEGVEEELAYAMESLGIGPDVMRRRVEETLDLLGLAELRDRPLATLSGGQAQRVAIGSVLTAQPRVLVLDEPTSALDPQAAEDVLATLQRLVDDLGLTVLLAEHRLERVIQYADRLVVLRRGPALEAGGRAPSQVVAGRPVEVIASSPVAPPVVELGRLAGWSPLPLSVRDARRAAGGLRRRLAAAGSADAAASAAVAVSVADSTGPAGTAPATAADRSPRSAVEPVAHPEAQPAGAAALVPPGRPTATARLSAVGAVARRRRTGRRGRRGAGDTGAPVKAAPAGGTAGDALAATRHLVIRFGALRALDDVSLDVRRGEIVAVMGRNGAGKSTLLRALVGLAAPDFGDVVVAGGLAPTSTRPSTLVRAVGLVPQQPADLLYADSVGAECVAADHESGAESGSCQQILRRIAGDVPPDRHPRDLSEGQRLALALAVVLTSAPPLVLLDEPTRGLDYGSKRRLVATLRELAAATPRPHGVVLATHDVELVAEVASRVVVLADGQVVADGATEEVVTGSPMFAPQVAKVLAPQRWLTVAQVASALAGHGGSS